MSIIKEAALPASPAPPARHYFRHAAIAAIMRQASRLSDAVSPLARQDPLVSLLAVSDYFFHPLSAGPLSSILRL